MHRLSQWSAAPAPACGRSFWVLPDSRFSFDSEARRPLLSAVSPAAEAPSTTTLFRPSLCCQSLAAASFCQSYDGRRRRKGLFISLATLRVQRCRWHRLPSPRRTLLSAAYSPRPPMIVLLTHCHCSSSCGRRHALPRDSHFLSTSFRAFAQSHVRVSRLPGSESVYGSGEAARLQPLKLFVSFSGGMGCPAAAS